MTTLQNLAGYVATVSFTLACLVSAESVATDQTPPPKVSSTQPMPGEQLKLENLKCPSGKDPVVALDNALEVVPAGSGDSWTVTLPPTLTAPKAYSMRWKCTPVDPKDTPTQIAILNVLPLVPQVTKVVYPGGSGSPNAPELELKDRLALEVRDLKPWREQSQANANAQLHLYLNGIELKNLTMVAGPDRWDEKSGRWLSTMAVTLEVEDKDQPTRKAWIQALQSAIGRSIPVTVGPSGGLAFPTATDIHLRVFPRYTWLVVIFLITIGIALTVLGKKSSMLRDDNGSPNPPYSLAKHQMAVWFILVVGAYLYVWLITGTGAISSTALILIGISGATGLTAIAIDQNKRQDEAKTRL